MPSPTEAWRDLRAAMRDTEPACRNDDRFTSETADPQDLLPVCQSCPLIQPCENLARSGNILPVWGVLAGISRRGNNPSPGSGPRRKLDGIYG